MRLSVRPILALLLLVGCASTPKVNHYTLGSDSSGSAQPSVNLVVVRFSTTDALARRQILIQKSPTEIEYYAADQWAGTLGELVQRKLAAEFGPAVDGRRTLVVSGTVVGCEQIDAAGGAEARLRLEVVIRDPEVQRSRPPLLERTYTARRVAGARTAPAVVQALAGCVEDVAAQIADDASAI